MLVKLLLLGSLAAGLLFGSSVNQPVDEAWTAIVQLGGRRHLLEQARVLFALAIEKAKDSPEDAKAREMIEAKFTQLALLLKHNWRRLFVPQMHAHSCIELYADMCSIWEQLEIDSQWEPMA